jgi:peptide/nickel transport system substrate-binding protein
MRTLVRNFYLTICVMLLSLAAIAQPGGELRFCIHADPKTFNPLLVGDDPSDTVRYLTGGVLLRINRITQQMEPELAKSWKISPDGRKITFKLRSGVYFSDGTPFSAEDVAYTMQQLMDPSLHSPTGDQFRSAAAGNVETTVLGPDRVTVSFPEPVAGLDRLFDQVAIMSAKSPKKEMAVLGPFYTADYKPGNYVLLKRNPNYWRHDASGKQLPYLDSVRLYIQQNHDLEVMRFVRGEIDLINTLDAEYFEKLASQSSSAAHDAGVGFDTEQIWFNQVPTAPIPAYKKAWFTSTNFRRAISQAVNREDLARVVFHGHARPAVGAISPANTFWFNNKLKAQPYDVNGALQSLAQDRFRLDNGTLRDRDGHAVEFSVITNSGNKYRLAMVTMMQQDLAKIGIRLNVVTLDFPSLIERISHTFNYESCLLGLVNDDLDPSAQMNVWLSSSSDHQWNPEQKTPATAWEAELDKLMHAQASTNNPKKRKQYVDRVQEIVYEQNPFVYLVNKDGLSAISTNVQNANASVLRPQTFWNIDELSLHNPEIAKGRE